MIPIACAAGLGVASSFGDWLWTNYLTDGALLPAIVHGVLIFLLLAMALAWAAGSGAVLRRLVLTLPLAGLLIAALFYPLAGLTNYVVALLISWVAMWLSLALLQRQALKRQPPGVYETIGRASVRGLLAAVGSGMAFWMISGIWTEPSSEPVNYVFRAAQWAFAFLPGFLALLLFQPKAADEEV